MARVTVEDCILRLPNRFELVMIASQRARDLAAGAPLTTNRDNDKNPVVALREIADKRVSFAQLEEQLIRSQQKYRVRDESDEDLPEFDALEGEAEAAAGAGGASAPAEAPGVAEPGEETGASAEAGGEADAESLEELAEREADTDPDTTPDDDGGEA